VSIDFPLLGTWAKASFWKANGCRESANMLEGMFDMPMTRPKISTSSLASSTFWSGVTGTAAWYVTQPDSQMQREATIQFGIVDLAIFHHHRSQRAQADIS
jgi:hypothetical protein